MRRPIQALALSAVALLMAIPAAMAGAAWDEIRANAFGGRTIEPAGDIIQLTAPMRPTDQRLVPVAVEAGLKDGRTIRSLTLIVDANPSPIAAVFEMGGKREALKIGTNLRLNAATDVRAVVETSDGKLYMASRFVKFAGGQGACAAPAMGTPEQIAANMGKMTFAHVRATRAISEMKPSARLTVSHPNHTGMVMDQITLLYVPLRIITDLEVRQGAERVLAMKGSITLSQDPTIEFDYRVNGADKMQVLVKDSDGASWQKSFPIGQGS